MGREAAQGLVQPFLAAAAEGFHLGDTLLKEYGHGLFSMAAELLGEDFAPFLQDAATLAVQSLSEVCANCRHSWPATQQQ